MVDRRELIEQVSGAALGLVLNEEGARDRILPKGALSWRQGLESLGFLEIFR
jgi:hypothetical protein